MRANTHVNAIKRAVTRDQDMQYTAGLSFYRMIKEHTHDEYRDMLLTLSVCNVRDGRPTGS